MKRTVIVVMVVLLLALCIPAFAGRTLGQVNAGESASTGTKVPTLVPHFPGEYSKADIAENGILNKSHMIVWTQQTKPGDQGDSFKPGDAAKWLYFDKEGVMRIDRTNDGVKNKKPCMNRVLRMWVQESVTIENGRDGRDGLDGGPGPEGPEGAPGARGPRGPRGPRGEGLILEITPGQMALTATINGPSTYSRYEAAGSSPMGGFSYQGDINVAGGAGGMACATGGSVGDINNTNTNSLAQNTTVAIKSKNVSGSASSKAKGASGNKNQRLPDPSTR